MSEDEHVEVIERADDILRAQFGCLADTSNADRPSTVTVPGHDYAVHVFPATLGQEPMLRIVCPVAGSVDWATDGLTEFLLRENSRIILGRFERCEDGITVEHATFARTSEDQLAQVVLAMAQTAAHTARDLFAMGALTGPGDDGLPSR